MKENFFGKILKNTSLMLITAAAAVFAAMLLIYSKAVSEAVIGSIKVCLTVIIPSLFGFMAVSNIIINSNLYIWLSKPFYPISRYILRIPPELFSVFLLSNIGGYPIGVKLLSGLVCEKKITQTDAASLMCGCYCSGPAFLIGAVGINIFSNTFIGFLIYGSILLSNLIITAAMGLRRRLPEKSPCSKGLVFSSKILIDSVEQAAKTLSMICSMLIFFSAATAILCSSGLLEKMTRAISLTGASLTNSHTIIKSIIEISTVTGFEKYSYTYLPIITGLCAFGGICVLVQLSSISGKAFKMRLFYLTRPFQILLCAAISFFLIRAFSREIAIMTLLKPASLSKEKSILPALILIIMIILLIIKNNSRFLKKGMI